MRRVLVAIVMAATLACGGGKISGPAGPSTGEPSQSDWLGLAAELAAIGADALQAALSSPAIGTGLVPRVHALDQSAPTSTVNASAIYFCCGGSLVQNLTVASTLTIASGGSPALVQAFSDSNLSWKLNTDGSPTSINLSMSGVTLTGALATSGGAIDGVQRLQLSGAVTYTLGNGEKKIATFEVWYSYSTYPTGAPTASGQMGPAMVNGALPQASTLQCTNIPREGCPPCTLGGCGPAPCGRLPACPK